MDTATTTPTAFIQRLRVPWWGWPLPLAVAQLLAAEFHMGLPGVHAWLPYVVMTSLTVFVLMRAGSTKVAVAGDELQVGKARVPLSVLGDVEVISRTGKQKAMGPHLDPAAFVLHRGWIGPMVKVELRDPQDPTPYWLFSVKSADKFTKILRQKIADARTGF